MRKLILILLIFISYHGYSQVPDTETFDLDTVLKVIGTGNSLQDAFNNADSGGFDPTYNNDTYAPPFSLLRFRNYGIVINDIIYDGYSKITSGELPWRNARGLAISSTYNKLYIKSFGNTGNEYVYSYSINGSEELVFDNDSTSVNLTAGFDALSMAVSENRNKLYILRKSASSGNNKRMSIGSGGSLSLDTETFTISGITEARGMAVFQALNKLYILDYISPTDSKIRRYNIETNGDLTDDSYFLNISGRKGIISISSIVNRLFVFNNDSKKIESYAINISNGDLTYTSDFYNYRYSELFVNGADGFGDTKKIFTSDVRLTVGRDTITRNVIIP